MGHYLSFVWMRILFSPVVKIEVFMETTKKHPLVSAFIVFLLAFLFYWYDLRPRQIVKQCNQKAATVTMRPGYYETQYLACLREYGFGELDK